MSWTMTKGDNVNENAEGTVGEDTEPNGEPETEPVEPEAEPAEAEPESEPAEAEPAEPEGDEDDGA